METTNRFRVTIHRNGETIAQGEGEGLTDYGAFNWAPVAKRLYNRGMGRGRGRYIALQTVTTPNRNYGVQFGRHVGQQQTTLDPEVRIWVEPIETAE